MSYASNYCSGAVVPTTQPYNGGRECSLELRFSEPPVHDGSHNGS